MSNHSVKPEDILPDGIDATMINGTMVRKGSIAAFLANTNILENQHSNEQQKRNALNTMKALAPSIVALGLHHHVIFKNVQVEQILVEAAVVINDEARKDDFS